MKKISKISYLTLSFLPMFAFAAVNQTVQDLIVTIRDILNAVIPLLIAIGVIYFLWGVVQFIMASGDEAKRSEGKTKIIYGLIGIFVMIAFWGLVNLLIETVNLPDVTTPTNLPTLPEINI